MRHTLRSSLPGLAAALAAASLVAGSAFAAGPPDFRLTLLHGNDGESRLLPDAAGYGGAAAFTTVAQALRAVGTGPNAGVVMVSSGDNFLAGPQFSASLTNGVPFYDALALDAAGYDVLAFGNHDFDFNPDVTEQFVLSFPGNQPFVSANLDFTGEPGLQALVGAGRIGSSVVLVRDGRQIGIVGGMTPRLPFISSPRNVVVDPDLVTAVQNEVDALDASGVKIIVFISHLQSLQEDLALLPQLRGIDIAVAGGGSEVLANPGTLLIPGQATVGPYPTNITDLDGKTVPVITTEGDYYYVGRLTADFDVDGELVGIDPALSGPVRVATPATGQPDAVTPDAGVLASIETPVAAYVATLATTSIGTSEVALDGRRTNVRSIETNQGNLIADALRWQANQLAASFGAPTADVALQNGGGIRNNAVIPAGGLTELNTYDMVPFANYVCIVPSVSRETFREILENAVSRVEFGDGRFAQIAGFRMLWNPTGTPRLLDPLGNVTQDGDRVMEVILDDGTPIVLGGVVIPGPALNVASIDFLARGGDQYPFGDVPFTSVGQSYQQAVSNYIRSLPGAVITAAEYPEGGEGRITRFDPVPVLPGRDPVATPATAAFSFRALGSLDGAPRFEFALPARADVALEIYGVDGRRVAQVAGGAFDAGTHTVAWNGRRDGGSVPAGVYFARIRAGERVAVSRFVLAR